MVVLQTQNRASRAARVSGTRGSVARVSGRNVKFFDPAARGSGTRGSGAHVSGTNSKFSKPSRAS